MTVARSIYMNLAKRSRLRRRIQNERLFQNKRSLVGVIIC